ncbi:MAG: hypothetical protein ACOH5I_09050 [Oligoflexus sp.]
MVAKRENRFEKKDSNRRRTLIWSIGIGLIILLLFFLWGQGGNDIQVPGDEIPPGHYVPPDLDTPGAPGGRGETGGPEPADD